MGLFGNKKSAKPVREGYWLSISYQDFVDATEGDDLLKAFAGSLKEPFGTKSIEWCHPTKKKTNLGLPYSNSLYFDLHKVFKYNNQTYIYVTYEFSAYTDYGSDTDKFIGGPIERGRNEIFRIQQVMKSNGIDISHFEAEMITDGDAQMALLEHVKTLFE